MYQGNVCIQCGSSTHYGPLYCHNCWQSLFPNPNVPVNQNPKPAPILGQQLSSIHYPVYRGRPPSACYYCHTLNSPVWFSYRVELPEQVLCFMCYCRYRSG